MRRAIAVTALTSGIVLALASPALAAGLTGQQVANAYNVTMTAAEAKTVGLGKGAMGDFGVTYSAKGTPDAPWLCDLTGPEEVEGAGAKSLASREYLSSVGKVVSSTSQEVHIYDTAKQAKKAYDGIMQLVKRCEGQHVPDPDADTEDAAGMTVQLTNGTKKAKDGDAFLWVQTTTTFPASDGYSSHEYLTVRHFDRYIQIIEVESEGQNAAALTAKQLRAADLLTDRLGDRWRASFR